MGESEGGVRVLHQYLFQNFKNTSSCFHNKVSVHVVYNVCNGVVFKSEDGSSVSKGCL